MNMYPKQIISDEDRLRLNAIKKKHYHKCKDYYKGKALRKYNYNGKPMTGDDYTILITKQDGKCALCGCVPEERIRSNGAITEAGRLEVDHDHVTKNVRGLLCHLCNKRIGGINDTPETLLWWNKVKDYIFIS